MGLFKKDETVEIAEEIVEVEEVAEEETDESEGDFEVNGKPYFIRYNQARIGMYERTNKPVVATFIQNGGGFSIDELKSITAYGISTESGAYIEIKRAREIAQELLEENGYTALLELVSDALQRDCGFLFK